MSVHNTRSAIQLRDFIDTNHIYVDGPDEDVIGRIRKAAQKESEEIVPSNVTKRKGKARRSLAPRFPPEWATSRGIERRSSVPARQALVSVVPREVMSLFSGFEKLDDRNWNAWKGHMRDNLGMCELWDIVIGTEKRPSGLYNDEADEWIYRDWHCRLLPSPVLKDCNQDLGNFDESSSANECSRDR
ncbi:hypothetical protein EPUL_002951 [Erysiphe pulchra]|uniref:Uncharacterized protein n=1 Tax=Erysiphe pulchra TaxID=225359 RepID=A0A2S4PVT5_9PEZI|nr:hypothetical protein EPUL_002951 [Erysiphe pulchra]